MKSNFKIVFVSRLDSDCSLGAYLLCEIAPDLAQIYRDLQIFILGGGEDHPKIKKIAEQINNNLNRQLIFAPGCVTNPTAYFDKNTLFVGVSRAALEAMAHSLPVILLGNEGFLGLLDKNKVEYAQKTNFTCRGAGINAQPFEISTQHSKNKKIKSMRTNVGSLGEKSALAEILLEEINKYFALDEKEKERLQNLSYNTVKNGYTVSQMAQKTLDLYNEVLNEHKSAPTKIAICGYYGHKNLGDEAILYSLKRKIKDRQPYAKIQVVSGKNPFRIFRSLYGSDLFIFGGGSLLQNATSNASLIYYLSIIRAANLLCNRKIMLANGIGPIKTGILSKQFLLMCLSKSINTFDYISTRDTLSQNLLSNLLPNRKVALLPDPALLCFSENTKNGKESTVKNSFIFIPCSNGLKKSKISIDTVAKCLLKIQKSFGLRPIIAVFNEKEDLFLAHKIKKYIKDAKIICPKTKKDLSDITNVSRFAISQRYHGTLFASAFALPTLAISNDPKMNALCKDLALFECQDTNIFSNIELVGNKIEKAIDRFKNNQRVIADRIRSSAKLCDNTLNSLL